MNLVSTTQIFSSEEKISSVHYVAFSSDQTGETSEKQKVLKLKSEVLKNRNFPSISYLIDKRVFENYVEAGKSFDRLTKWQSFLQRKLNFKIFEHVHDFDSLWKIVKKYKKLLKSKRVFIVVDEETFSFIEEEYYYKKEDRVEKRGIYLAGSVNSVKVFVHPFSYEENFLLVGAYTDSGKQGSITVMGNYRKEGDHYTLLFSNEISPEAKSSYFYLPIFPTKKPLWKKILGI